MKTRIARPSLGHNGFTLLEIMVVVAIVGILAAIALPQLLGAQEKAKKASCDDGYTLLNGMIINKMESHQAAGDNDSAQHAIDDTMAEIQGRQPKNPRNLGDAAYEPLTVSTSASFVPTAGTTCKVYIYDGTTVVGGARLSSVVVTQFEGAVRSYRLTLN